MLEIKKNETKNKINVKGQNGSITLFVLIALMFFLILAFSAYARATNKIQSQESEFARIKSNYEKSYKDEKIIKEYREKNFTKKILTALDISEATDKTKFYGATVNGYNCKISTDVGWKIFYASQDNIYLIADNYIERDYLPSGMTEEGTIGNKLNTGDSAYSRTAYFENILDNYSTASSRIDNIRKALNNDYFNINKYSSIANNMKVTAYMLDITAWSNFEDTNNKAEFVIGGPTLEMLFSSYNQKYGTNYKAEATSEVGYKISKDNGANFEYYIIDMLNVADTTYVLPTTNALAMWIATPSDAGEDGVMFAHSDGSISNDSYTNKYIGFRPVVCLNANVKLQQEDNGNYTILDE